MADTMRPNLKEIEEKLIIMEELTDGAVLGSPTYRLHIHVVNSLTKVRTALKDPQNNNEFIPDEETIDAYVGYVDALLSGLRLSR